MSKSFQFLSLQNLKNNTANLLAAVHTKHEQNKKELYEPRRSQVAFLDGLHARLTRLTVLAYDGDLREEYINAARDIKFELKNLSKNAELSEEQKLVQKKLMKQKASWERVITGLILMDLEAHNEYEARERAFLNDEQKAMIFTGAYLAIKKEIEYEYSGVLNSILGKVINNTPDNSVLYAGIDAAIGITAENPLDEKSKKEALDAYAQFEAMSVRMNVNLPENVKDEDIRSLVSAKHKLKKINQPADKVEKPRYEDSINATLLLPNPEWVKQAQDDKVPASTRKILSGLLSTYTPGKEIGRYVRDENSEYQLLIMKGYKFAKMSDEPARMSEIQVKPSKYGLEYKVYGCDTRFEISWDELPDEFPKHFTNLREIEEYLPFIQYVTWNRSHTLRLTGVIEDLVCIDPEKHLDPTYRVEWPDSPGKVREAKPEEVMSYEMSDKQYKLKKIPDKKPVKVLSDWKGGYKEEDVAKVKSAWKGVQEPVEYDFMKAFTLFNGTTKPLIEEFKQKSLKHVEPKVTNECQVKKTGLGS